MVKPVMAYMDILKSVKDKYPEYPMFVYQVSGEYAMIYSGAKSGAFELKAVLMEILESLRRAGLLFFSHIRKFQCMISKAHHSVCCGLNSFFYHLECFM